MIEKPTRTSFFSAVVACPRVAYRASSEKGTIFESTGCYLSWQAGFRQTEARGRRSAFLHLGDRSETTPTVAGGRGSRRAETIRTILGSAGASPSRRLNRNGEAISESSLRPPRARQRSIASEYPLTHLSLRCASLTAETRRLSPDYS
jgi:hypothetical protein